MQPPAPPKVQFLLNTTRSTVPTVLGFPNKSIDNYLSNPELSILPPVVAVNGRRLNTLAEAPSDTRKQYYR